MTKNRLLIEVKFFAAPREALGTDELEVRIPAGSTVRDLVELLEDRYPALESYTRFLNVAVNRVYVGMQTELHDGDEVACLPPVGGGQGQSSTGNSSFLRSAGNARGVSHEAI